MENIPKQKASELFEGEHSSLKKTFDEAVAEQECNHQIESNMCKSYCRKCGIILPAEQRRKETWEVKFGLLVNRAFIEGLWHSESVLTNDLKHFISQTLQARDTELLEQVEKIQTEYPEYENNDYDAGAKKVKEDFINLIKE